MRIISLLICICSIWSCRFDRATDKNLKEAQHEMNISLAKNKSHCKLKISFNLKKIKSVYYDPNALIALNKDDLRHDGSLITRSKNLQSISGHLKKNHFVIENENLQRKILVVDYDIVKDKKRRKFEDNFFDTLVHLRYPPLKNFVLENNIFSLDELRVTKLDRKIRIIYVSNENEVGLKKLLTSNWISLP